MPVAGKRELIEQLAAEATAMVTSSYQNWTSFLTTAARLYKYPFPDQLLIYAQKPDATACAEHELWNNRMRRYVKRGSKGIVLLDQSAPYKLRFVYDVSDTVGGANAVTPFLWQYKAEYADVVSEALKERFDVRSENGLVEQLRKIAEQQVNEYWNENRFDIPTAAKGSALDSNSEVAVGARFRMTATVSTAYVLFSRCGLSTEQYYSEREFASIGDFNTRSIANMLGDAVAYSSGEVLRQIERAIKNYELERRIENDRNHVQAGGRLSSSEHRTKGDRAEADREVREDALEVSERTSAGALHRPSAVGAAAGAPTGDRRDSGGEAGTAASEAGEESGSDGTVEAGGTDALGGADERLSSTDRRTHSRRADLQLTFSDIPSREEEPAPEPEAQHELPAEHTRQIREEAQNFRITDEHLGEVGAKAKFRDNLHAIKLLKALEAEDMQASAEQQAVLSRYVGWGGLADAFDDSKSNWANEYAELREVLTPEEYEAARASVLNAHFTSPTVIRAIYDAVASMGFQSGNILEPSMGTGNFFGMLPEEMLESRLYGVELDSITGRIAQQLYPRANITVAGFETTSNNDFFDLVVGNVPFGQYRVNDAAYNKLGFPIHDYFIAKAVDQTRAGGLVALVTSRYTLDKQSPEARKYIAQRAELLGAIRLPNNAFRANAGTDVVSDILFLQKRDRPVDAEPSWVHLGQNADGYAINSYFIDHPEMVLGIQTSESTQYGREDFTVAPIPGAELSTLLRDAVVRIHGTYEAAAAPELEDDTPIGETLPADPNVKNHSFAVIDGKVYYREDSVMVRPSLNATAEERVKGMVAIRDSLRGLIDLQLDEFATEAALQEKRSELNALYDSFAAQYGRIVGRGNRIAFSGDNAYHLLCSLEETDAEGEFLRKAAIFERRTVKPYHGIDTVDTASEALAVSIGERAQVDLPYMSSLCGKSVEEITQDLQGLIFQNPTTGDWETADAYLSGNVRLKLRQAEWEAQANPAFQINVEALKRVLPKDLDASEIEVQLGATWVDPEYYRQFMIETFKPPFYTERNLSIEYEPRTGEWNVGGKNNIVRWDVNAHTVYGTPHKSAYQILENALNLRDTVVYDTVRDIDGKERRVVNRNETLLAEQRQELIGRTFREWVWQDPERRRDLVTKFNEEMNNLRPRTFDGSHIVFPGMNTEIMLREHQRTAIARVLYGGNTLLAHEVGAGKTFEMVASAMESKRLGLCNKPMFVVPNHLIEQWASEFLRLYPSANILVTTKKDFTPDRRMKFCARIATGEYDAVIIGQSQFERIPISKSRQIRMLKEEIEDVVNGLEALKRRSGSQFSIKQLEKMRRTLAARLEKLQGDNKKDDLITFEQLGVDRLFVDESDMYKNLFLYTKMRGIAGISTAEAQRSSDMYNKCRYMDEITGGKGVVFATGTPVSNSITEIFTLHRYLQHDDLQRAGIESFDAWASRYCRTIKEDDFAPEGTGFRIRQHLSFVNLPEMMSFLREVADIKTSEDLDLPVPDVEYHVYASKPTETQKEMVKALSVRAERIHNRQVKPEEDNMLNITSDGRKLGLDQRILNPLLPDEAGTKVNQCVFNVLKFWEDGAAEKHTQLIFCDLSTPKSGKKGDDTSFSVYEDIKQKLIDGGIPREEIAFIHDADSDAKKKELFAKVRSGTVRVLIGSTAKMGAGMNVQDRLIAIHDLDCPWRPRDLTQRQGRIVRQGNMNPLVHVCRYVTEGTFDAYLWQMIEKKQRFISQIMTSKTPVRSCEDIDETVLSYAEIKTLCAGDPRIKERMELDVEVSKLRILKADHMSRQYRLQDDLTKGYPERIERLRSLISGLESDIRLLAENPVPAEGFAGIEVRGKDYIDRESGGQALLAVCKETKSVTRVPAGHYRGMEAFVRYDPFDSVHILELKGRVTHQVEMGTSARGNIIRADNVLEAIPNNLKSAKGQLEAVLNQEQDARKELGKPFPHEQELAEKSARLEKISEELALDGGMQKLDGEVPEQTPPVQSGIRL